MKQLTQATFAEYADWIESMAIDSNGELHGYAFAKKWLLTDNTYHHAPIGTYSEFLSDGYDTDNWQNSAIDREV